VTHNDVKAWGSLNWPNRISIMRLLLIAPFVILVLNQQHEQYGQWARRGALAIFIIMACSDAIDGMLARRLNARTRLGAILDPLADKVLITVSVILLSLEKTSVPDAQLPSWVVVATVGKDLWISIGFVVIYLVTDYWRTQPSISGKLSTLAQACMVSATLVAPDMNWVYPHVGTYLATRLTYIVAGLCVAAVVSYTRMGLSFIAHDQKPLHNGTPPGPAEPTDNDGSD